MEFNLKVLILLFMNFATNNLSLELSPTRYIKMGITDGLELKNGNSIVSMNNNGLLNIQAHDSKRLWMEHAGEGSGVGLQNGESNIVLADNGDIGLSNTNGLIRIRSTDDDDHPMTNRIDITSSKTLMKHSSKVEIKAPSVDIVSSDVEIESSDMRITSDNILIRANKNS